MNKKLERYRQLRDKKKARLEKAQKDMDRLEQMDLDTLRDFGAWLESEGLQAIATRVSTGEECQIIIEDGMALSAPEATQEPPKWKAGEF